VVRTAFGKRRKMLRNSLREWTKDAGISFPHDGWDRKRPEALAPAELAELARYLRERLDERA
jgi:16S rRNA A1518/A1519 N6-dimethyltransferase RsmA/KsgA/DIM1 with predicted DNA glycosylase/AP lyase activity